MASDWESLKSEYRRGYKAGHTQGMRKLQNALDGILSVPYDSSDPGRFWRETMSIVHEVKKHIPEEFKHGTGGSR